MDSVILCCSCVLIAGGSYMGTVIPSGWVTIRVTLDLQCAVSLMLLDEALFPAGSGAYRNPPFGYTDCVATLPFPPYCCGYFYSPIVQRTGNSGASISVWSVC